MRIFLAILLAGATSAWLVAQQQPSLQDALNTSLRLLGACQVQADLQAQRSLSWEAVKQQIEAANPALLLDLQTKKLTPKPEAK